MSGTVLAGDPTWCTIDHAKWGEGDDDPNTVAHSIKFGQIELSPDENGVWTVWGGHDHGDPITPEGLAALADDVRRAGEWLALVEARDKLMASMAVGSGLNAPTHSTNMGGSGA